MVSKKKLKEQTMSNTVYLFSAFSITWAILYIYIFRMVREQHVLKIKVDKIEEILEKDISGM